MLSLIEEVGGRATPTENPSGSVPQRKTDNVTAPQASYIANTGPNLSKTIPIGVSYEMRPGGSSTARVLLE